MENKFDIDFSKMEKARFLFALSCIRGIVGDAAVHFYGGDKIFASDAVDFAKELYLHAEKLNEKLTHDDNGDLGKIDMSVIERFEEYKKHQS